MGKPLVGLPQGLRRHRVQPPRALGTDPGEAVLPQYLQVLGHGGLGNAELVLNDRGDRAGSPLAVGEELQDSAANGVAQDVERVHHTILYKKAVKLRVVVLADTHAPRRWKTCPPKVAEHLREADVILHAGDVCVPSVLDELAEFAPVHVVAGNNDGSDVVAWGAPETLELTLAGLEIAMIHDSGQADGRPARMRRRFPNAGLRIFNPGSPTDRRRQPQGTIGELDIEDGRLIEARIIPVT
jgi:predicted phosphodiesterase